MHVTINLIVVKKLDSQFHGSNNSSIILAPALLALAITFQVKQLNMNFSCDNNAVWKFWSS